MHPIEAALLESLNQQTIHLDGIELKDKSCSNSSPQIPLLIIAYSGGLDSSVLLHAAVQLLNQSKINELIAAHVNHGIQAQADSWQAHCQHQCEHYQIDCFSKQLNLAASSNISEEDAREARYGFFAELIKAGETIAFAHHQDDQAETLLFRLFRGTGIHGMGGIPTSRKLASGNLVRPLLAFSRQTLLEYANDNQLNWIEDPSNQSSYYSRNFIRNELMPLLRSKWSSVSNSIAQFSNIARDQIEILDHVAEQDRIEIETKSANLELSKLAKFSPARKRNLLHYWIRKKAIQSPSIAEIDEVLKQLDFNKETLATTEKSIKVKASNGWVRSFNGQLYYCKKDEPNSMEENMVWQDITRRLNLNNGVVVSAQLMNDTQPSSTTENLQIRLPNSAEVVSVRPRAGGETGTPGYREHSTELKKIYQELKIPSWKRKWLPIVYYNNQLVAVPGVFVEKSLQVTRGGVVFCLK